VKEREGRWDGTVYDSRGAKDKAMDRVA